MQLSDTTPLFKKFIQEHESFALFGHHNIDGDALGSLLGLGGVLEHMWKKVDCYTSKDVGSTYHFLSGYEKISTSLAYDQSYDALIFVDFSSYDRIRPLTQWKEDWFDKHELLVIDHHHATPPDHALVIKDTSVMSNCERIYEHICACSWSDYIDSQIATYLYLWLTTDSGNFLYDTASQSSRLFRNAASLIEQWADKHTIIDAIFRSKSLTALEYVQTLLETKRIYNDSILMLHTCEQHTQELWLDRFQAGWWMTLVQSLAGIDLVVLCKEDIAKWMMRVSFRWRGKYDCSDLAHVFGGGGHANAAWCSIDVPDRDFPAARKRLISDIFHHIDTIS